MKSFQTTTEVTLIAALDQGGVIGSDGGMPWHAPADLRWFKEQTRHKPVLMGRKTFEAIGGALPKRRNMVMTRRADTDFPGCETVSDLDEALANIDPASDGAELMIIGGAEIYALTLAHATRLLLTRIEARYAGDTFFPDVDWSQWTLVDEQSVPAEGSAPACRFMTYRRRSD